MIDDKNRNLIEDHEKKIEENFYEDCLKKLRIKEEIFFGSFILHLQMKLCLNHKMQCRVPKFLKKNLFLDDYSLLTDINPETKVCLIPFFFSV